MALIPAGPEAPPPALAMMLEWPRAAWTLARLAASGMARDARGTPSGDGRPVLVLPGLFNSDRSNLVLRAHLRRLGYRAYGWGLGRNLGVRTIGADCGSLIARIAAISDQTGEPVTLVGVSLGGIMARIVAHRRPELVRQVITVSSPFAGSPRASNVWRQFQWLTGEKIGDPAVRARLEEAARPLPVPSAAIWSRSDGLVNGFNCREGEGAACRSLEVRSSHLFVQMNPQVLRAVAELIGDQRRLPPGSARKPSS